MAAGRSLAMSASAVGGLRLPPICEIVTPPAVQPLLETRSVPGSARIVPGTPYARIVYSPTVGEGSAYVRPVSLSHLVSTGASSRNVVSLPETAVPCDSGIQP